MPLIKIHMQFSSLLEEKYALLNFLKFNVAWRIRNRKNMDFPGRKAIQLRSGKFLPTIEGTIDKLSADFRRHKMEWNNCWCASLLCFSKQMRSRIYYFTAIGLISGFKASNEWRLKKKPGEGIIMKIPTRFSWSAIFFARTWRFGWGCSSNPHHH